ncbi:MAG: UDP-glucose/GDP-mannose dehydrogenase family protein [Acidobacteria bacterium]|nr:UDP-glucose/GDP-mannose dehydrogenase family protein [Acidobacteriota bacterium]MCI0718389.1 UDP-glucose/GDP-mannose dehydrogenase family protein [Acidobacteriota bacterium]
MKLSVVGAGYVGLVTGVCLAEKGHEVVCVDVDSDKVDSINKGVPPIHERGLKELLERNLDQRFRASTNLVDAITAANVSMIAVGTPFDGEQIDLTYVCEAARQVGTALRKKSDFHLTVVKSTVVPGTTDNVVRPLLEQTSGKRAGRDFGLGMNPEFLTEGQAVEDFMSPDRIVLGAEDARSHELFDELYRGFPGVGRLRTNNKTAEMIKYTSNCLLATLISFSNEIANLCSAQGEMDVVDVMRGLHLSNYLSWPMPNGERQLASITSFLAAGCGYGGSCLPKDLKALIAHGKKFGCSMPLLKAVEHINEQQPGQVLALLRKYFPSLQDVSVAVLGLAFRPDTADIRESPAIPLIRMLLAQGAKIKAYDPVALAEAKRVFQSPDITFCDDLEATLREVDAAVLVTRWDEFCRVPELIAELEPAPVFVDGRRMLNKRRFARYEGIGL